MNNISIRKLNPSGLISGNLLRDLHWLPVERRIDFKVAVLGYKGRNIGQPRYLGLPLAACGPLRDPRSCTQDQLAKVLSRTATASSRFSCAAPTVWNNLPFSVRSAQGFNSFKLQLKTHFYRLNFQWPEVRQARQALLLLQGIKARKLSNITIEYIKSLHKCRTNGKGQEDK